jgi:prevent-host-death family protein
VADVPVRELNQDTAGVLARVKQGERVNITERGRVIASIIPASDNPLSNLINSGKLRPAAIVGPPPRPGGPVKTDHEAGELLREMRDSERY